MNILYLKYTFLAIFLIICSALQGQCADSVPDTRLIHQVGFGVAPGYIIKTNRFFRGVNKNCEVMDMSLSLHLKYSFSFGRDSHYGMLYPNTYQGIGVSYNTFFNTSEIGDPVAVYLFQGSRIARLSKNLSLDYEWNFGASFGWKQYDENNNHFNIVIGSNVNAYMNLGLFLNWKINQKWKMSAGIAASHYSNGNTSYPNHGLNDMGIRVGMTHIFDNGTKSSSDVRDGYVKPKFKPGGCLDVIVYGAVRSKVIISERYVVPGSFGVFGLNLSPMYGFNKYFRLGMSVDAQFDQSANLKDHIADYDGSEISFYRPPLNERIGIGLSLRGEFVMPVFSISVGIGHNVIYKGDDLSGFYQVLALKTNITKNIFLHTGYQLSKFHDPNNLMLGIGYRFW